ncbi:hypothetical protein AVEN_181450-1 [Araneus ventricosus]|uniref:Uncharacterized protein n=1 Tax=Araneus ventricosus TaxID=182803 RepID=A0A4Y2VIZ8_ARAVE|nr:hypothetical protein AVEN_181450-1 [Araneus ventricosus]
MRSIQRESIVIVKRFELENLTNLHVLDLPESEPAGVFSPKLSRILPQKGAVSPSAAWLKKFEPTVIQNPMTIRRFFIIVIEKYLDKESHTARFHSCRLKDKLT